MKSKDCLKCLLKAAASAPREWPAEMPFGMEQRILARWRSLARNDETGALLRLVRWAFACALLVIFLTVFFNYRLLSQSTPNEWNIADSVIKLSLLP